VTHFFKLFCLLLLLLPSFSAFAAIPTPAPPEVSGSGHLLIDFTSGQVLSEDHANERLEPASLTKIMTAYVVFRELTEGNLKLADEVLVSEKAWRTQGSRMFIEVGKKVSIEELLKGMIIQSGNDASVALAEHIAGSEETFATVMNAHAQRLGMINTNFVNATGLPHPDHYTTAEDIAKVAIATVHEFPEFYKWYAIKSYKFNNINQHNRNKLLWRDDAVDGMKTGHTEAAGYCLVASALKDGMRLVSVVMGTESEEARAVESLKLLNYGFRFFETHKLYGAGETLSSSKVWKGASEQLPVGIEHDLNITIPRNQYDNLNASMHLNEPLIAPINKGQQVGEVVIELSGETLTRLPLVALKDIEEDGIIGRTIDHFMLMLE
jgi:D-alanyl-D-alanine carboxypeptidase (penicillin-binding protein 5/6)